MLAPGESTHSIKQLKLLLNENDIEVIYLDSTDPLPGGGNKYKYIYLPLFRRKRLLSKLFGYEFLYDIECIILKTYLQKIIKRYIPDIIHVHCIDERILYLKKAGAKPIITSVWGTDINQHFSPDSNPYLKELKGKCLAAADFIIVDSGMMDKKCEILARRPLRHINIPIGIDTDLFKPGYESEVLKLKEQLKIDNDFKIILSARGWRSYYNQESILDAFAEVLKTFPKTILVLKLHNHQTVRILVNKIKDKINKLNINDNVRWLEDLPLENLPIVYNMSDIIVNYPSMDTLPITFMEAAACCKLVVSCKLPTYEGTFAEKYFTLVDGHDISDFAEAINTSISQSSTSSLNTLYKAREFIIKNYEQKLYISKLLNIYKQMIIENT